MICRNAISLSEWVMFKEGLNATGIGFEYANIVILMLLLLRHFSLISISWRDLFVAKASNREDKEKARNR